MAIYITGGSLDEFGQIFGGNILRVKRFFLYEILALDNGHEVLLSSEPFAQPYFYSSL